MDQKNTTGNGELQKNHDLFIEFSSTVTRLINSTKLSVRVFSTFGW